MQDNKFFLKIFSFQPLALSFWLVPRPSPAETSPAADLELHKARAQELLAGGQAGEAYDAYMGLLRAWPADDAVCLSIIP
ncbi:MAG: hypothetical protein LBP92_11780 [Deltaproteobacteria bacterium]|jgi:hypothetical protein|nr:hypothetical protein [Deltaproteobacteria bacterium]